MTFLSYLEAEVGAVARAVEVRAVIEDVILSRPVYRYLVSRYGLALLPLENGVFPMLGGVDLCLAFL